MKQQQPRHPMVEQVIFCDNLWAEKNAELLVSFVGEVRKYASAAFACLHSNHITENLDHPHNVLYVVVSRFDRNIARAIGLKKTTPPPRGMQREPRFPMPLPMKRTRCR